MTYTPKQIVGINEFITAAIRDHEEALETADGTNDEISKLFAIVFRRHQILGALTVLTQIRDALTDVPVAAEQVPVVIPEVVE